MRCKSWQPRSGSTLQGQTRPGGKKRCWVPCTNELEPPRETFGRCLACAKMLVTHPDIGVRIALANEAAVTQDLIVLAALASDISSQVAAATRGSKLVSVTGCG